KEALETFTAKDNKARFDKLSEGEVQPDGKDKALLQLAAKYYTYQLTWKAVQQDKTEGGGATKFKKDLEDRMTKLASQPRNNKEFLKQFAHELVVVFKEMLALDFRSYHYAVTNTALMLPALAKCRQEEVHEYLM